MNSSASMLRSMSMGSSVVKTMSKLRRYTITTKAPFTVWEGARVRKGDAQAGTKSSMRTDEVVQILQAPVVSQAAARVHQIALHVGFCGDLLTLVVAPRLLLVQVCKMARRWACETAAAHGRSTCAGVHASRCICSFIAYAMAMLPIMSFSFMEAEFGHQLCIPLIDCISTTNRDAVNENWTNRMAMGMRAE
eukprot:Transcript_21838.p2 GENE.Transcript_21838~~Transcript_21838.p2  ORF type:complete len:192 (-),score=15.28 Transcript_21838:458-1033(-)